MTVVSMPNLSEAAAKHARRLARRPEMPTWTPLLMVVLGVFFVVYMFVALITPSPSTQATAPTTTSPVRPAPTSSTPQASSPSTSPSPTANQTLPSITSSGQSGAPVTVPTGAVTVAQAAALGVYTTHLSSVPLAQGSTFPALTQAYPNVQLVSTAVVSYSPPNATFRVTVDPGPPASPGDLYLDIVVTDQNGQWSYVSGG